MAIDYGKQKNKNTVFGGTEGILVPSGTTNDRGDTTPGRLRYNTELGFMEQYNNTGWAGIDAPPTVTNISGIINENTDSVITITGSNFKTGSTIAVTGAAVSGLDRALATTFVNSSTLTAQTNASSVNFVAGASFNIKITNPSGLSAVLEPAGNIDSDPVWTTPAGNLGTFNDEVGDGATYAEFNDGGTDYSVFYYGSSNTFIAPFSGSIDALIVGGGGAGGSSLSGGGGGGAVLHMQGRSVTQGTNYPIVIGNGGTGQRSTNTPGLNGESTTAFGETATGGQGASGRYSGFPSAGANGAGGAAGNSQSGQAGVTPSASGDVTVYAGNSGGNCPGNGGSNYPGAGGAGAGGNGQSPANQDAPSGNGGPGIQINIDGNSYYWAGGGGGSSYTGGNGGGQGGLGGGGGGSNNQGGSNGGGGSAFVTGYSGYDGGGDGNATQKGGDGAPCTGGGGGSGSHEPGKGGDGGNGIVVIKFAKSLHTRTVAQLTASDPDGGSITYSLVGGALPSGTSINATTGAIEGYPTGITTSQSFTITVRATSNSQSIDRTFNFTIKAGYDGSRPDRAAPNAKHIKDLTGTTKNGWYWIKPTGYTGSAQKIWCDMSNDGGGWMLMSYAGVDVSDGRHVRDQLHGYDNIETEGISSFNMFSLNTNSNNTVTTSGWAGNAGQVFIDRLVQNGQSKAAAKFRIHDAGTTWRNYYFIADASARWYPVNNINGAGARHSNTGSGSDTSLSSSAHNDPGVQWLKSCYYNYTADSGNNGAGTVSGSPLTHVGAGWGTYPHNFDSGDVYGENWGYSISPTYSTYDHGSPAYSNWQSCHSQGWNRAGSFWLKVVD